jgi:hypothetical protein
MNRRLAVVVVLAVLAMQAAVGQDTPVRVGVFPQEIARSYTTEDGLPSNDVTAVWFDGDTLLAVAGGKTVRLDNDRWVETQAERVRHVLEPAEGGYRLIPRQEGDNERIEVRMSAPGGSEPDVLGTDAGLFLREDDGLYRRQTVSDGQGRQWAASDVRGVAVDTRKHEWFATLAGVGCHDGETWKFYTGAEGLPYNDFTCMAAGGDGSVWFGTKKGAIRFKDSEWNYRQGRCWIPDDQVNAIAVDQKGGAWIATPGGIGWIGFKPMTLAEKAAFFEDEMDRLIKRTEYGYTAEAVLKKPGDKSTACNHDSDNDGLWTGMYGAGECFAYGATKSPAAKQRAARAFEAMRFLQKVTQTSEPKPPKGYVARTILPGDGPDPNAGRAELDRHVRNEDDPLWKVYDQRWPKTADGKWYWKSDTSSDELDGHYFFYPAYYDLVADTPEEKERVREVVRDLTDHLIDNGFTLTDHDGKPTRWGIYGPDSLNNDPNWWPERGIKSLSMLSYLAVAAHITGDLKYTSIIRELVERHGYRTNAMFYKVHFGPGSGNQSDDEMAFMCFYNLMKYSQDDGLKRQILYSFYSAWTVEQPEMNPFFNFCYAAFGRGSTYSNAYGLRDISPWPEWLEDSIFTLKDISLDRVTWTQQNSHRIDIVRLSKQQAADPGAPHQPNRGHRFSGKVLPASERSFCHWNTDPWQLDTGYGGKVLGSGTIFLLPYYMGLYHGFIVE